MRMVIQEGWAMVWESLDQWEIDANNRNYMYGYVYGRHHRFGECKRRR